MCTECKCGFGGCEILRRIVCVFHESLEGGANDSEFMIPLSGSDRESDELTEKFGSLLKSN